ncbi:hypothetical protein [Microvirga sp. VF16]|uniref:hypothetical protein n=1 Tax=Microvirga sp. VF16 TaxID=2807101 RepID=UPI0035302D21
MSDAKRKTEIEGDSSFVPVFNSDGLLPTIATDVETGVVLMLAWMNRDAPNKTIVTGEA